MRTNLPGTASRLRPAQLAKGKLKGGHTDDVILDLVANANDNAAQVVEAVKRRETHIVAAFATLAQLVGWDVGRDFVEGDLSPWRNIVGLLLPPNGAPVVWRYHNDDARLFEHIPRIPIKFVQHETPEIELVEFILRSRDILESRRHENRPNGRS